MEKEDLITLAIGVGGGVFAVLMYQKLRPATPTVNSQLANVGFTLMQSIKTAADKGQTAKELYDSLTANPDAKKMKTRRFIIIKTVKSPYISRNGSAHAPHAIGYKLYRKGEQLNGKIIKDGSGKALYMMPTDQDGLVIPLDAVKEVVTKDVIVSNAEGTSGSGAVGAKIVEAVKKDAVRFKYADAAILGALAGFGIYKYAAHKTWITPENKNLLLSIGITSALSAYVVYRFTSSKKTTENE